jgi:methionine-rich copper-binding protein CopC
MDIRTHNSSLTSDRTPHRMWASILLFLVRKGPASLSLHQYVGRIHPGDRFRQMTASFERTDGRLAAAAAVVILTAMPVGMARAQADGMGLISSSPQPHDVVSGSTVSITLRFNAPIDRARSRLTLKSGEDVRTLTPRLSGSPNYLFSSAGRLPPGSYELVSSVRSADGRTTSGTIPFTVK